MRVKPRLNFLVCIYLFQADYFCPGFVMGAVALVLAWWVLPFWEGDIPASCGVRISRLVRFSGASCRVSGFGARGRTFDC